MDVEPAQPLGATSRTCAAGSKGRAGRGGGRATGTRRGRNAPSASHARSTLSIPGQRRGCQAPGRLCRSAAGPGAVPGVGRAVVSDHGRSQAGVAADLPQAPGQPAPPDLRAGHPGRDRHPGRPRVDRRGWSSRPFPVADPQRPSCPLADSRGRRGRPDDLVFTAPQGGPLREQKFVAGIFKPAAVQAGLPHRLRFHDLRHTCASLLIAQGASVKAVQAQLGHASATVTLDRYGHLFPDELQRLADRLQDAYAGAVADPARTEGSEAMLRESKGAGQRPAPAGGGGETRTPVPRRRPRASPSAAAG
jgi:Phage integrase family